MPAIWMVMWREANTSNIYIIRTLRSESLEKARGHGPCGLAFTETNKTPDGENKTCEGFTITQNLVFWKRFFMDMDGMDGMDKNGCVFNGRDGRT